MQILHLMPILGVEYMLDDTATTQEQQSEDDTGYRSANQQRRNPEPLDRQLILMQRGISFNKFCHFSVIVEEIDHT